MNFRKMLSFLITLVMIFTFGVFANTEGSLQITYINADNSAIHIEFSNGVEVSALENKLTVSNANGPLTYTVIETVAGTAGEGVYENGGSVSDNAAVYDNGITYSVKLDDGITFGEQYIINISEGLSSSDGALSTGSAIKKAIKVNEIFTEDFSTAYEKNTYAAYVGTNKASHTIESGALTLPQPEDWQTFTLHPFSTKDDCIGNSDISFNAYLQSKYGDIEAYKDITVSAMVKAKNGNGSLQLVSAMQNTSPHRFDNGDPYHPQHTILQINNSSKNVILTSRYGKTNDDHDKAEATKEQVSYTRTFSDGKSISTDAYCEVKLSSLGGKVKGYIDNYNVMSLENAKDESNGIFAIRTYGDEYYIDDICLTKAEIIDQKPLEFTGFEASKHDIVLQFSAKVSVGALENAITLENADGFTIEDISTDDAYKYRLIIDNGIILDREYVLCIAAGLEAMSEFVTPLENPVEESIVVSLPEVTLDYINADASSITLEFSERLDFDQLKAAVSLKNAGAVQDFEIYDTAVEPDSSSLTLHPATYQIVPKNGMKLDSSYEIEIKKGILSEDGEKAYKKDFTKLFSVTKILFDGFTYTGITTSSRPYALRHEVSSDDDIKEAYNGVEYKYKKKDAQRGFMLVHPYYNSPIGDGEIIASKFTKEFMQTQKNYTIQADFKIENPAIGSSVGLLAIHKGIPEGSSEEYHSFDYKIKNGVVHNIINTQGGVKSKIETFFRPSDGNDEWNGEEEPARVYKSAYADSALEGITASEYKTVRLSVKDGYFKGYFGLKNTASYYDEALTDATGGIGIIFGNDAAGSAVDQAYYVDNLYVTRMVDVIPFETSIPNGSEEVSTKPEIVINAGSLDVSTVNTSTVIIKTEEKVLSENDYTVSYDDSGDVKIEFKKELDSGKRYYVDFVGVKLAGEENKAFFETFSFETKPGDFLVDSFTVMDAAGNNGFASGNVTVSATVKNNYLTETQKFVLSICVYNEKNQLVAVKTNKYALNIGEEANASLDFVAESDKYKAKCFVWSDFTSMTETLEEKVIE